MFDDLYAEIQSQLGAELEQLESEYSHRTTNSTKPDHHYHQQHNGHSLIAAHIRSIAQKLFKYEYPHSQLPSQPSLSLVKSGKSSTTVKQQQHQQHENSKDSLTTSSSSSSSKTNPLLMLPTRSVSKIKMPTLDAFKRIHAETFPLLDHAEINRLISLGQQVFVLCYLFTFRKKFRLIL